MIRMVWWAAALFLAGGCTLGVAAGGAADSNEGKPFAVGKVPPGAEVRA